MPNLSRAQLIAAILAALVLAGLGAGLTVFVLRDTGADAVDRTTDDAQAIEGARIAVTGRLPQAQAVSFGEVFVRWDGEIPSVCGAVDILEEQDSFAGSERFVWSRSVLTLEEIDGGDVVAQKWSDLCE